MGKEFLAEEESNKALMRRVFDAIGRGDKETLNSLLSEQMVIKLPYGHPVGGTYRGIAEITKSREQGFAILGISRVDVREIFAEGPSQVIVLLDIHGTDAAGKPWSMPGADLFKIVDGKITELFPFFYDTVRLQEIAGGRRADVDGA
jgi:ketosteroid isomerase-like protein